MITTMRIQNFKCLLDTEVELGPLTVLIGSNDSGKTSFLDAIRLLGKTSEHALSQGVQSHYRLRDVESFYERSGKPELRPKEILRNICAEAHDHDSTELRTAIAECTDIDVLKRNCPLGFRPFAEKLEAVFGPR